MPGWLVIVLCSVFFIGFFVLGMSLTLLFKGHHIESEISENHDMQERGIKCVIQETRELDAQMKGIDADCDPTNPDCGGNCNICGMSSK